MSLKGLPWISFFLHPGFANKNIIFIIFSEMFKAQNRLQATIQFFSFNLDMPGKVFHYVDIKENQSDKEKV